MPIYRIEISPNNRAGCQDALCKKTQAKIKKGEPRFGTWVEIKEHGSWRWKHWGCVSGKQLENLRDDIRKDGSDSYDFDKIDGYDGLGDPAVQAKIRTAMIEGKIADEDFKGDPKCNVLGQSGIRGRATKKKADAEDEDGEDQDGDTSSPAKKPAKKRGRKQADDAELAAELAAELDADLDAPYELEEYYDVEAPPAKKARNGKSKEQTDDDEDAPLAEALKAKGPNKVKPESEADEKAAIEADAPKKKGRAKKVKAEPEADEEPAVEQPKKKGRAKKIKAEPEADEQALDEPKPKPELESKPEPIAKRGGRKKKTAANGDDHHDEAPKAAPAKRIRPKRKQA